MEKGLRITGASPDGRLAEIIEIGGHPWFLGCQFHPEFKSRPTAPHPLFSSFHPRRPEREAERMTPHPNPPPQRA